MEKILLIEDDKVVRENTAEILELVGYEVITASNGKIGVSKAKKQLPNIIISDIMMPELNGYGVLQILSKDVATKNIPFIFLSAKTERTDIRKGMNLGADDYITKPFDESELFSAIESRLAKVAIYNEIKEKSILNKKLKKPTPNKTVDYSDDNDLKTLENLQNYFINNGEERVYEPNEIIYHQGNNSNHTFLLVEGVVKTFKIDEQGKELITSLHKENDFFGFSSFSKNIPYQEFATAIEKTKVYKIAKRELKKVLENNHHLTLKLIDFINDNVSEIKEHLLEMAYSSVRKKTASTILQFSKIMKNHTEESMKISRSDLASIAGIATETFIRTLSDFKKEGIIDIEGRNIKIINMDKLIRVN